MFDLVGYPEDNLSFCFCRKTQAVIFQQSGNYLGNPLKVIYEGLYSVRS